jgi:hypothetical protein
MVDAATELGRVIGKIANQQSSIRENMAPDDTDAQLGAYFQERMIVHGQRRVYQYDYADDSFVLDHPVHGELDSSYYQLDGGYSNPTTPVILSISNDADKWVYHGTTTAYIDTDNTTATVDTNAFTITF